MTNSGTTFNKRQGVDVRPCHNCGGNLEFDISDQRLACKNCGHSEEITHAVGAEVQEQPFEQLVLKAAAGLGMTHADGEKEIVCQNCGGHTTFLGSLTATRCPYCATPIQRNDVHEAPDRLAVDGVLPFVLDSEGASEALRSSGWTSDGLRPTNSSDYSTEGSFQSVYAAYFTFDAHATTDYRGQRGRRRQVKQGIGKNARTVTVTDWRPVSGTVYNSFDDMAVLANDGFNPKYVNALEPWPTDRLKPYNPDYISGHLCRTYDRDAEQCFDSAKVRMSSIIDGTIRRDIGGDEQRIDAKSTHLRDVTYKHALLPIWLLTVIYAGQPWQVFMNGATGEIHGERPWSKVKIAVAVSTGADRDRHPCGAVPTGGSAKLRFSRISSSVIWSNMAWICLPFRRSGFRGSSRVGPQVRRRAQTMRDASARASSSVDSTLFCRPRVHPVGGV